MSIKEMWFWAKYSFFQTWAGWEIKVPLTTIAIWYSDYLGGTWRWLLLFYLMIIVDLIFGVWLALKQNHFDVNAIGRWIVKLGSYSFVIAIVGVAIESVRTPLAVDWPVLDGIIGVMICTEVYSILKKMPPLNLPVPEFVMRIFPKIKEGAEKRVEEFFSQPENDRRRSPRPEIVGKAHDDLDPD